MKNGLLDQYRGEDPKALSSLSLAYIGDAVFEMLVRMEVMSKGSHQVSKLNAMAKKQVNAGAQHAFFRRIEDLLTDEERAVFRRGRNAKSYTVPKHADLTDYRHATGLEALFGYLYLEGRLERVLELYAAGKEQKTDGES